MFTSSELGGVPRLEYQADCYYVNTSDLVTVSGEPLGTLVTKCTTGNLASHC